MDTPVVLKFIELYGKNPTANEYRQYEPYFYLVEFTLADFHLAYA
jgi:hypothetical protein